MHRGDVFAGCISLFYNLFYELVNDDIHLWCLHYTFLPVIIFQTNWKNAWVHHRLRCERNSTLMQLWIRGLNSIWGSDSTTGREVFQVNVRTCRCIWYNFTTSSNYCEIDLKN